MVLLLLGGSAARAQTLSPGPLAEAHASLDDESHCDSCHTSGKGVDDNLCKKCHEPIASRIRAQAGLHGRAYRNDACSKCHPDHMGDKGRMVRWPGGALEKLDHAQTGYALEGKHAQVPCTKCHDQKTRGGRATFLNAKTTCAGCHKDPHQGRLKGTCESCHKVTSWKEVDMKAFDHRKTRYPLLGKHEKVECKKCHGEPAKYTGIAFAACNDCHKDPHLGRFQKLTCEACHQSLADWKLLTGFNEKHPEVSLAAGHAEVTCKKCHDRGNLKKTSAGPTCVACHKQPHKAPFGNDCKACHENIRWLGLPLSISLASHTKTAYQLRGKHVDTPCAGCHNPKLPANKRFRDLSFSRCISCHKDKHEGEFARQRGGDCAPCHGEQGYLPTTFGVELHATTKFPLEGKHEAAPCGTCHLNKRPRVELRVAKRECLDCHPNPHKNEFAAEMAKGGCAQCHSALDWKQAKVDHSRWPLLAAHKRTPCARCHGQITRGEGQAQTATAQYRGIPKDCEGCHADVHGGQFRLNQPVRLCDFCHTVENFKVPSFAKDHAKLGGWPLDGKHAPVKCEKCHPKEELRNGEPSVRYRLGYHSCKACHADPHGGA